jgi:hypothetical protein
LEWTGLLAEILESQLAIEAGRKLLDTEDFESDGRTRYRYGLALAMKAFQEVGNIAMEDLELLILAEYTFLTQELRFCDPTDTQAVASLTRAVQSFDDAFRALEAAADGVLYRGADLAQPRSFKYRIKGMPKDAFHIACMSHRTRLGNILRSPGINLVEKELLKQRSANLSAAQSAYLERQRAILISL